MSMEVSAGMMEQFNGSKIWEAILNELNAWEKDLQATQSDPDEELSERHHASLRGSLKAIDRFRQMPLIMAENVRADEANQEALKLMEDEDHGD